MANTRIGNSYYVDTTGTLTDTNQKQVLVTQILLTATAASAILVIVDPTLEAVSYKKMDLRVATSGDTKSFEFDTPVLFPNGIKVLTLTNAVACIVGKNTGG